jgi:hypothetical protein
MSVGVELTKHDRVVFQGLEKRKLERESECDSCGGSGCTEDGGCGHCLGQGVLLTADEYALLLCLAGLDDRGTVLILPGSGDAQLVSVSIVAVALGSMCGHAGGSRVGTSFCVSHFGREHRTRIFGPGYGQDGCNYCSSDDHEFWHKAPNSASLIRDTWSSNKRQAGWDIALRLLQVFQTTSSLCSL